MRKVIDHHWELLEAILLTRGIIQIVNRHRLML